MKTISIVVPESAVMQAVAGPQYCFTAVNQFRSEAGKEPAFIVQLIGAKRSVKFNDGSFSVQTDKLIGEDIKSDLVIIPPLFGDLERAVKLNKKLGPWIIQQYESGAEIASLCEGAFLLANTGLLDGKKCSTHWGFIDLFREMYPKVDVQDGSIITEENRIYSSGGANSYWNLLLYLVEKYTDRQTAILLSKYFAIDINRQSQYMFAMFRGQKSHNDESIKLAQEYIEQNIDEKITVEELAEKACLGRRSFERRFREATSNSVLQYIQRVKMEAAKRSFETSRKNVNEVMFDVGYSDTKAFRATFRKITGLSPVEYRNMYNKVLMN
ncbi:MAG TPA: helix-turn-helix domain-containing protein [Bacteroidales bacterium]|nr:helix-turn-helix domain-containing protein [Bacteroidales bacterium]HRX96714.1 helix-turn-helix domain-containing protein [Bacteroidales bacterium]